MHFSVPNYVVQTDSTQIAECVDSKRDLNIEDSIRTGYNISNASQLHQEYQ